MGLGLCGQRWHVRTAASSPAEFFPNGLRLIVSQELRCGEAGAGGVDELARLAEEKSANTVAYVGEVDLCGLLARVFPQGVARIMAHDHRHLVISERQLVEDPGKKRDLAARHAERIHLR